MTKHLNQLHPDDAVLSESTSSPRAAFLGGLEDVKLRLSSKSDEVRIAALAQALKYGQVGKNWVFQIVKTETGLVQWAAYDLLWENSNEKARQKLLKYRPLRSEVGVDYTRLRDLLAAGQWKEADGETKEVMLKTAGREKEGLLDRQAIEKFPAQDLRTIDHLWVQYSHGRFGFSVQKRILQSLIGNPNADKETSGHSRCGAHQGEHVQQFGDQVGWRVNGDWLYFRDLSFNSSVPKGHLPSPSFATPCDPREGEEQAVWGKWCVSFCFGGIRCGVLFLGWWSLLDRKDL